MFHFPYFSIASLPDDIEKIEVSLYQFLIFMSIICYFSHWYIQIWLLFRMVDFNYIRQRLFHFLFYFL